MKVEEVKSFVWDETNRQKLRDHDLDEIDIEWTFWGEKLPPHIFRHPKVPDRWIALGFTLDGSFVLIVFEHKTDDRSIRVVTAYRPTNERWWRLYAQAKGIKT